MEKSDLKRFLPRASQHRRISEGPMDSSTTFQAPPKAAYFL